MGVIVTFKFHVIMLLWLNTFVLVLGTDGAASHANGIVIYTSDVLEGIGVEFRDASGNLHPTYIFTLCCMCFVYIYLSYILCTCILFTNVDKSTTTSIKEYICSKYMNKIKGSDPGDEIIGMHLTPLMANMCSAEMINGKMHTSCTKSVPLKRSAMWRKHCRQSTPNQ